MNSTYFAILNFCWVIILMCAISSIKPPKETWGPSLAYIVLSPLLCLALLNCHHIDVSYYETVYLLRR